MKSLFAAFVMTMSLSLEATIFQPVSTETQIQDADGIVIGQYLRSKSVRLEDNSIATQMFFKMEKEYGLRSDFFGLDEVIIHYPGGTISGESSRVDGVPKFVTGEKVALYTKSLDNRYWGMNLGFGSYRVINYGRDVLLVNTIFPQDSQVGQVKLSEFERLVKKIKGSSLKVVQSAQYLQNPTALKNRQPASAEDGKNRRLASQSEESENNPQGPGISAYWLLGLLAFFGGLFRMSRQRKV